MSKVKNFYMEHMGEDEFEAYLDDINANSREPEESNE